MDRSPLLDADGLIISDAERKEAAVVSSSAPASLFITDPLARTASAVSAAALVTPSSALQPWSHYFTLHSLTRRKSAAIVMAEAAEDTGSPTPPSHSSTSRPPSPSPSDPPLILPPSDAAPAKVGLRKVLTVWDVVAYGVSATIGAGIFVSTGAGTLSAGPAVVVSFLLASLSCLFSAFAYCEFASRVPVAGSAYTFTYVTMGELAAWFIGWNLTLEYCISAAAVARAWASNFLLFWEQVGVELPGWLASIRLIKDGDFLQSLSPLSALICLACTGVLLLGVKESSRVNMAVTIMNISIILFIIIAGAAYVSEANYTAAPPLDSVPAASQCNTSSSSSASALQHVLVYTSGNSSFSSYLPSLSFSSISASNVRNVPNPAPASGRFFARGLNGVLTGPCTHTARTATQV